MQHTALANLDTTALPEEVVASLFDRNPLPMWIYDLQTLAFLAVNDAAIESYGYSRDEFLGMTIADIRPAEDVGALRHNVAAVQDSLDRAGIWRHLKKDRTLIHVEITSYPIDFLDQRAELVIAYDVSQQVADEYDLGRLLALERIITRASRKLLQSDDFDSAIMAVLRDIGEFGGASRAYLFRFDTEAQQMSNTHEWCSADVAAQIGSLQRLPMADFRWSLSHIVDGDPLSIQDVSALPVEAGKERETLERQGIRSLIMVPVPCATQTVGFLGFDNVHSAGPWDEHSTRLLGMAAELIGTAIQRRRDRDALAHGAEQMQSIMHSAEHFVFYRLSFDPRSPHHARVEFVTDSLREIVGIEPDAPFETWFQHVHPDDLDDLRAANTRAAEGGEPLNATIRMWHPVQRTWRWIQVVSNPVHDSRGELTNYNGILLDVSDTIETAQALASERDFAEAVMDTVGALIVVLDREGRIVQFNRACEQATGFSFAEVEGRHVWECLLPESQRASVKRVFENIKQVPEISHYENHWVAKDGHELLIEWSNTAITGSDGAMLFGIGTGIDVTERRKAEAEIRKLSRVVDQAAHGVMIIDDNGILEYVNPAFVTILGEPTEQLLGRPTEFLGTRDEHAEDAERIWQVMLAGETWRGELDRHNSNGKRSWLSITVSPIRNREAETTHFAVLVEDVTRLKQAQQDLERMASYDPLTRLTNRRLFKDRLAHALEAVERHGHRLALLYLDLDNFKRVNDSLGHDVGDSLLCEVARRLEHAVRREDTVARMGGDEFVILLHISDGDYEIGHLANKLLQCIREPIIAGKHEVYITASIGITFAPEDSRDAIVLMRNADLAMYRVKSQGRDDFGYFEKRMNLEAARRLNMESELRQALNAGLIRPFFQPIVRLDDLHIVGFEALARWPLPEQGFVPPDQFIAVAEDSGLILPLGESLLQQAAEQLLALRAAHGEDLYVSVNFSAKQTADARFFDTISSALEQSGLPPHCLQLELTESVLMRDIETTGALIGRVREHLGSRIAIDDFGTGYSSLSYLKRLPIDSLKVDRSFVRDIPADANDVEITAAIVAMAKALNKEVIAEGVETREQLNFLRQQGCHFAQGYLFARAEPPRDFLDRALTITLRD